MASREYSVRLKAWERYMAAGAEALRTGDWSLMPYFLERAYGRLIPRIDTDREVRYSLSVT